MGLWGQPLRLGARLAEMTLDGFPAADDDFVYCRLGPALITHGHPRW